MPLTDQINSTYAYRNLSFNICTVDKIGKIITYLAEMSYFSFFLYLKSIFSHSPCRLDEGRHIDDTDRHNAITADRICRAKGGKG